MSVDVKERANHPSHTLPKAFPRSLQHQSSKYNSLNVKRDRYRLEPRNSTYQASTNGVVRFEIPNARISDFRRGYLQFTLTPLNANASSTALSFGAWSIIKVLRVICPGILEQTRDYNRYASQLMEMLPAIGSTDAFGPLWGTQNLVTRQANANGSYTYAIPLISGVLMGQPLPLPFLKVLMVLELELAPAQECFEDAVAAPTLDYTLSNITLNYDLIDSPQYQDMVGMMLGTQGLNFDYRTAENWRLTYAPSTNMVLEVSSRRDAVDGVLLIQQPLNYDTSLANPDKFLYSYVNTLIQAQLERAQKFFPMQPYDVTGNAVGPYIELCRLNRNYTATGLVLPPMVAPIIHNDAFTDDRFYLWFDINGQTEDGLVSTHGTSGFTASMKIYNNYSAAPAAQTFHAWVFYYTQLRLTPTAEFATDTVSM